MAPNADERVVIKVAAAGLYEGVEGVLSKKGRVTTSGRADGLKGGLTNDVQHEVTEGPPRNAKRRHIVGPLRIVQGRQASREGVPNTSRPPREEGAAHEGVHNPRYLLQQRPVNAISPKRLRDIRKSADRSLIRSQALLVSSVRSSYFSAARVVRGERWCRRRSGVGSEPLLERPKNLPHQRHRKINVAGVELRALVGRHCLVVPPRNQRKGSR